MTALAGFWQRGDLRDAQACRRMLTALQVYAPGAPTIWSDGRATLGRRLHRLLPEDEFDRGIVRDGAGRALAADVRLDNRAELGVALGVDRPATLSDAALLSLALERWGTDALDRLVGDFAFAWWDAPAQRLVLARDFFGARPLHYHQGDGFVAFASMPKGLHALPQVLREPDRGAVSAFLTLAPNTGASSFFAGIRKVASGHYVAIDGDGVAEHRHWRPQPRLLHLPSADHYAEAMREQMDRAVAARLRGTDGHVGSMLSAGLDSSTVAATAARLLGDTGRVTAFTAVPRAGTPDPAGRIADEGPLAAAVAALYANMEHVRIGTGGRSPLSGLDRNAFLFDQPILNICNGLWADLIYEDARRRGVRVLLVGSLGNASFSHAGLDRLFQLFARGRWLAWSREAAMMLRRGTALTTVGAATVKPVLPARVMALIDRLAGRARQLHEYSLVQPDAAARPPRDPADWPATTPGAAQLALLRNVDFGNYNKGVLGGWGIDQRDPTADRRLVEFCLSVPPEQYLRHGIPRSLARRAFADRLPAEVVSERRKGYQAADWFDGVDADRAALADELAHIGRDPLAPALIDLPRATALLADWPTGDAVRQERALMLYRHALLRSVSTGHFLRKISGVN